MILFFTTIDIFTQGKKTTRKARVAIIKFLNNTKSNNYDWLSESLPDAVDASMKKTFIYVRPNKKGLQNLAANLLGNIEDLWSEDSLKNYINQAKVDYVIYGSFILNKKTGKIKVYSGVYYGKDNKIIRKVKSEIPTNTTLFAKVNDVASEFVKSIREYVSKSKTVTDGTLKIKSDTVTENTQVGKNATGWISSAQLQKIFNENVKKNYYPIKVEGRNSGGVFQFKASFAPYPTANFTFASWWGMDKAHFDKKNTQYFTEGKMLVYSEYFIDKYGRKIYQALWVKY
jgi:hypothetical protein